MRRIDLIRRALTTWDHFGPISYSKILWAKSYEPSRAKRSPVTKCDQKTPYRIGENRRNRIFEPKSPNSQIFIGNEIQANWGFWIESRCKWVFSRPTFQKSDFCCRQKFLAATNVASRTDTVKALADSKQKCYARNFYRQQKLDFRKVHRKEVHFAFSPSAFAPFRSDIDPDEVWPKP